MCISHGHHDHCGGLYRHNCHRRVTTDQKENLEKATYYIPQKLLRGIRQMYLGKQIQLVSYVLRVTVTLGFQNMDTGREDNILEELHPHYVVAEPESQHWIHPDTYIQPFKTIHRVPSQGYTVFQRRNKLKPEYAGLKWKDLKPIKDSGQEITEAIDVPLVSYTGDTILAGVIRHKHVMRSELLIIECTFLDNSISRKDARIRGHIHLEDFIENQDEFENVGSILLCHFSKRYKQDSIRSIVMNRLGGSDVIESFRRKIHILAQ